LDEDHRERLLIFCHLVKCMSSAVRNVNGQHIGESDYWFSVTARLPEVVKVPNSTCHENIRYNPFQNRMVSVTVFLREFVVLMYIHCRIRIQVADESYSTSLSMGMGIFGFYYILFEKLINLVRHLYISIIHNWC
jgi:hypothetical protein